MLRLLDERFCQSIQQQPHKQRQYTQQRSALLNRSEKC